jgi:Fe-S cluster assembly protein SufB
MSDEQNSVSDILEESNYKYGFTTDVESDTFAKGLDEDVVRAISKKKNEPQFMLDFRLKAFAKWKTMKEPEWPNVHYPPIDFQNISYYSAPKQKKVLDSLDEVDPEVMRTFEKLGIPLDEQKKLANVAVDAVFDSVSVATTHKKKLMEVGIIFVHFPRHCRNIRS